MFYHLSRPENRSDILPSRMDLESSRPNNWIGQLNGERVLPVRQFRYRFTIKVELMEIPLTVAVMVTEVFVRTLLV